MPGEALGPLLPFVFGSALRQWRPRTSHLCLAQRSMLPIMVRNEADGN